MAGGIGREAVDIGAIAGVAVSGKIPTTAAGGGSNVAITNISGNVRAVIQGVNITSSALDTNAVLNATEVAVTAGATPLPVNVVQTSAQIHVTAGGANLPVTVASQPIAVSVNAGVMVSGQIKTTAVGAGGAAVAITNVSGDIRVTAGGVNLPVSGHLRAQVETSSPVDVNELAFANLRMTSARGLHVAQQGAISVSGEVSLRGQSNFALTNVSGQVPITAGGAPLPVTVASQPIAVSIAAKNAIDVSAQGGSLAVNITNVSGQISVTAPTNIGVSAAGTLNVSAGGAYMSAIDTATSGTRALTSAVMANTSAIRLDMDRLEAAVTASALDVRATFSGVTAAAVTAAGGVPLPVNVVNVSGQINVTASNNIGVSAAGTLNVSAGGAYLSAIDTATSGTRALTSAVMANTSAMRLDIDRVEALVTASALKVLASFSGVTAAAVTAAGGVPLPVNVANVSGQVNVTATNNIPVTIAAQPIAVSIAAKAAIDVSAQGAALQVTAQGGSFAVSAQGGAITVSVQNEPLVDVCGVNRTGSAMNVFLAGTSAQVHVTAGDLPVPVSQAAPLGWEIANRGDAIFNALVSNPVKFGKLAQVAGAVCADIVAAVASRRIRVLGGYFNSTGTATAIFMTTGASAALTPKIVINTGFVLPINPYGYFETAVGSALTLQVEGGSVGGIITYQEVF